MSVEQQFVGKKILVTGAGRGIGLALTKEFHAQGGIVFAVSKSTDKLQSLKKELPDVTTICVDLTNWKGTREALEKLECPDVLINNAGMSDPEDFLDMTETSVDAHLNVNLKGALLVGQIVAKKMIAEGRHGTIVNVTSVAGKKAFAGSGSYSISKAALDMLTQVMAVELGPYNIAVNSVRIGMVDTHLISNLLDRLGEKKSLPREVFEKGLKEHFSSRKPTPGGGHFIPMKDVVSAILAMSLGHNRSVHGAELVLDGGYLLS